jgi:hypothetical protein
MKRQLNLGRGANAGKILNLLACAFALAVAVLSAAAAPAPAAPQTKPPAAPVPEIRFIKSEFVMTRGFGKDPFFPKSKRWEVIAPVATVETGPSFGWLSLKGISGSKNHRLAIINNKTFDAGEVAELRTPTGQTAKVKVVEIRDDGVVVSIGGQTQTLYLGPKL